MNARVMPWRIAADRPRLPRDAAAGDVDVDVETAGRLRELERLEHDHARGLAAEVFFQRAVVDPEAAFAFLQIDPGDRGLAAARSGKYFLRHDFAPKLES